LVEAKYDYLLNLAIVRIPLEKKLDPPIIEISLARSNLYEIAEWIQPCLLNGLIDFLETLHKGSTSFVDKHEVIYSVQTFPRRDTSFKKIY
jgi:hypothetical protein